MGEPFDLALHGAGIGIIDEDMARKDALGKRLVRVLPRWTIERLAAAADGALRARSPRPR